MFAKLCCGLKKYSSPHVKKRAAELKKLSSCRKVSATKIKISLRKNGSQAAFRA